MTRNMLLSTLAVFISAGAVYAAEPAAPAASPAKPTIAKICTNCHKAEPNTLRGYFENVSFKTQNIQIKIDDSVELIKFDEDDVKVSNSEGKTGDGEFLRETKKGSEIKIEFAEKDGVKTAFKVSEKQPIKVSADKLMKTADVEKLLSQGSGKAKYTLVDSRPLPRFQEGAIPTAINIPYPAFDKMIDKLPADKNALLVFYCSGST